MYEILPKFIDYRHPNSVLIFLPPEIKAGNIAKPLQGMELNNIDTGSRFLFVTGM